MSKNVEKTMSCKKKHVKNLASLIKKEKKEKAITYLTLQNVRVGKNVSNREEKYSIRNNFRTRQSQFGKTLI